MHRMVTTRRAELLKLQPVLVLFLVLGCGVVAILALTTLQCNDLARHLWLLSFSGRRFASAAFPRSHRHSRPRHNCGAHSYWSHRPTRLLAPWLLPQPRGHVFATSAAGPIRHSRQHHELLPFASPRKTRTQHPKRPIQILLPRGKRSSERTNSQRMRRKCISSLRVIRTHIPISSVSSTRKPASPASGNSTRASRSAPCPSSLRTTSNLSSGRFHSCVRKARSRTRFSRLSANSDPLSKRSSTSFSVTRNLKGRPPACASTSNLP